MASNLSKKYYLQSECDNDIITVIIMMLVCAGFLEESRVPTRKDKEDYENR